MGSTQRLTERFAYQGGKVDRTGPRPVIRDVLLCGPVSKNRRRYKAEAFAGDRVKRYDGKPVFLNHGDGRTPRRYEERIAKVINPRQRADGMPVGDLEVRPKHPFAEAFLDDAENDPSSVGMSHQADCKVERAADGWDDVTDMVEAESVDVVLDPATTKGLYEQTGGRTVPQISLKTFVERCGPKWGPKKWAAAAKLCEDFPDVADAPVVDEPPADAPEGGDLKAALMSVLTPLLEKAFESGDAGEAITALKDFIKLHAKHTGGAEPKDPPADEPAAESAKRPTLAGLIAEAKAHGLADPSTAQLAVLEAIPTPEGRKAYLAEATARVREAETPRSAGKQPGAGPLPAGKTGTTKTVESVPTTGAGFAALVKG